MGEFEKLFKKLIKIYPKLCEAHFNLGVAYKGLGKIDEEIKCYEATLKIDPNNPEANHNLSMYLLRNKNFKEGNEMGNYNEAARVSGVSREDFPSHKIEIFDHILQTRKLSFMAELFAVMAHSPGALKSVASVG